MKILSSADANRGFSALLKGVMRGETYQVTSRGKPVAVIAPVVGDHRARRAPRQALFKRLRAETPTGRRNWHRAELYD